MRKTSALFATIGLLTLSAGLALAAERAQDSRPLVPVSAHAERARLATFDAAGVDCEIVVGGGFDFGETLEITTLLDLTGPPDNLLRADAFYFCGQTNPYAFILTSGAVDFGVLPENPPGYVWVVTMGYLINTHATLTLDVGSRLSWNGITDCGFPLSGRPDCFTIN